MKSFMEKLQFTKSIAGFYIKGKEVKAGNDNRMFRGFREPSGKADTTDKNTYEKNHNYNGSNVAAQRVVRPVPCPAGTNVGRCRRF